IVARRFDAQGTPIGGDFQVGTHAGHNPSVSVNPALPIAPPGPPVALTLGDFVVTWSGAGIFARRFEATGRPRGYDDIQVSTSGDLPAVAMDEAEDFVVAWEGGDGISARPFYGATDLMGNQFQVNTSTIGVARPSVGMNANGNFVIAWDGFENPTSATNSVFARSYDASGSARGLEFGVNHPSLGSFRPAARMDAAGDFIISWQADLNFGEVGVFARRFVARTLPSLHISDAGRIEGQSGTTDFIFDVPLLAPSSGRVTVQYHTTDGTATAGDDYEATSGTLTFAADAPGAVSLPIVVHVLGDRRQEPNETFFVDLDPAANATISRSRGVGTIINDDADNTPVGPNVVVNPVDLATGTPSPVTLTFANVTQGGQTDVPIDPVGPPLPSGFALGDPPVYFHVSTTAVFDRSAGVVVCINYSGMTFPPGPGPRLFHSPPTPPEDVTAPGYPDEVHHIVCSRPLSSLSPFAVAQATNRPPVASAGPDQTRECSSPAGAAATLDGSHSSDPDGDLLGFAWTDEGGRAVGTTAIANVTVPLGTHPYVLTVMDPALATGSAATSVTVRDTTVPSIAISPARMTVAVAAVPAPRAAVGLPAPAVSDACDP